MRDVSASGEREPAPVGVLSAIDRVSIIRFLLLVFDAFAKHAPDGGRVGCVCLERGSEASGNKDQGHDATSNEVAYEVTECESDQGANGKTGVRVRTESDSAAAGRATAVGIEERRNHAN